MEERSVYRLQLVLLALYFAAAAALWPGLPQRIPLRVDLVGRPTAWTPTSLLSWFGLPLLAGAMTLLVYAMGRHSARSPGLWNIPEKDRFLALPPAERAPIDAYLRRVLAWCAILMTVSFIGAHVGLYEAAAGTGSGRSWLWSLLCFAPIGGILLLCVKSAHGAAEMVRRTHERLERRG